MNATIGTASAIIAALAAVIGLYFAVREQARKRAAEERDERERLYQAGRKSRDDEVALLRSQRDDARTERDEARAELRELRRGGG